MPNRSKKDKERSSQSPEVELERMLRDIEEEKRQSKTDEYFRVLTETQKKRRDGLPTWKREKMPNEDDFTSYSIRILVVKG